MKVLRTWLIGSGLALAGTCALAAQPAGEIAFNIPAQRLSDALSAFGKQAGLSIAFYDEAVAERTTEAISGRFTPEVVLEKLLVKSGLRYRFVNDKTVAIMGKHAAGERAEDSTSLNATAFDSSLRLAQSESTASDAPVSSVAARDQGSSQQPSVEEIVVTAQKRKERLIDTPQSVSVLSTDALDKLGATQFRDFANSVPGLSYQSVGAGQTQISLRGVTAGRDVSPTVAVYVDDVPYGSSSAFAQGSRQAFDSGLFDIEQIEVLRGPQGTLYGASTMGGLLKYVTRQPDLRNLRVTVRSGFSDTHDGGMGYQVAAAVNAPLSADRAALRVSGFQTHDGGYVDNLARNDEDANSADIYGGRADLLLAPIDKLTIRVTGFAQNVRRDGEGTSDHALSGAALYGELAQRRPLPETFDQRFRLVSGIVGYDFAGATLTSVSSYQTVETDARLDLSAIYVPLLAPFGGNFSAVRTPFLTSTDKFTQEVRVASAGARRIEWLAGGFYTRESSGNEQFFELRDPAGQPATNSFFTFDLPSRLEESAAFGNLTWHFTDRFDVSGGLRYARNSQRFEQLGSGLLGRAYPATSSSENVLTYLANTRYHFTDRATGYARYATGYRPGGPNFVVVNTNTGALLGSPTFEADRLKSYEIGYKAETEGRGFAVDVSAYFIDWSDVQVSVNVGGFGAIANAPGGADIRGTELSLSMRPVDGFTVAGAFAYQDAQMSRADANTGAAEGERLPNVPRFTATLNADYELPFWRNLEPAVGATYGYVSDRPVGFKGRPTSYYRLPGYSSVDLRAGVAMDRLRLQLYARNILDERAQLSLMFPQFGGRVAVLQPRTIGLTATLEF